MTRHRATITNGDRHRPDGVDSAWRKSVGEGLDKRKLFKQADRFLECHNKANRLVCDNKENHLVNYLIPHRCEYRICPICSKLKGKKVWVNLLQMFGQLPRVKGHRLMFLTLTKRKKYEEGELKGGIRELLKDVRKFINKFYSRKTLCGAVAILELGKNFNLHVHCIVFGPYIPQDVLSRAWQKITSDSYVMDIRAVRSGRGGIKGAASYTVKYITKPHSFESADDYAMFFKEMYRVRAMRTYGIFYNFKVIKLDTRCPICGGKYTEPLRKWTRGK